MKLTTDKKLFYTRVPFEEDILMDFMLRSSSVLSTRRSVHCLRLSPFRSCRKGCRPDLMVSLREYSSTRSYGTVWIGRKTKHLTEQVPEYHLVWLNTEVMKTNAGVMFTGD